MNTKVLQEKLLRVARANPPSDHVPLAFEQRVLAVIRAQAPVDSLAIWVRSLWKAAVPCLAVAMLFFAWSATQSGSLTIEDSASLDTQLESTLMASVTIDSDLNW